MSRPMCNVSSVLYNYAHIHMQLQAGGYCVSCLLSVTVKPTLMEVVRAISPGQPEMPNWVYNGAILGVQVMN